MGETLTDQLSAKQIQDRLTGGVKIIYHETLNIALKNKQTSHFPKPCPTLNISDNKWLLQHLPAQHVGYTG